MSKMAFVDIGELGWSLYLSAHLRWLKANTDHAIAIITSPDRKCLYRDSADLILDVPDDFYEKFKGEQNCFGIDSWGKEELKKYFEKGLPPGFTIAENAIFNWNRKFIENKTIYKSYEYSKKLRGKKKILVFPRYREHPRFCYRNLPKLFYIELIKFLCDKFPKYKIKTIGLNSGSYNIVEIKKHNYVNGVKGNADLQDLIDECRLAVAAVGGVSSLPKISLLQKVPTFVIGFQKNRFTTDENWAKTKIGFYEINWSFFPSIRFVFIRNELIEFLKGINK